MSQDGSFCITNQVVRVKLGLYLQNISFCCCSTDTGADGAQNSIESGDRPRLAAKGRKRYAGGPQHLRQRKRKRHKDKEALTEAQDAARLETRECEPGQIMAAASRARTRSSRAVYRRDPSATAWAHAASSAPVVPVGAPRLHSPSSARRSRRGSGREPRRWMTNIQS